MKLLDFAKAHDAELLPPVSEDQILLFEAERGLRIPPGLREFYSAAGGTNDFTKWSWRIWPFEELATIESRAGESPNIDHLSGHENCPVLADYLAFIDVLIEAPLYAVCANPANPRYGEVISLAGDNEPFLDGPIATFAEFEAILARHWDDIVLPNTLNGDKAEASKPPGPETDLRHQTNTDPNMINSPYEPPQTNPMDQPTSPTSLEGAGKPSDGLLTFISLSGSFSRAELLVATLALAFLAVLISFIAQILESPEISLFIYCLYPVWGMALGKRSRDLGTTFTYGMIIGMIFPIMGLVFLFQPGAKARTTKLADKEVQTSPCKK